MFLVEQTAQLMFVRIFYDYQIIKQKKKTNIYITFAFHSNLIWIVLTTNPDHPYQIQPLDY